ncbi:hypothetical protein [Maribacter sp. 2304DJ31-5]|uniref:hypothetical protein n=1 Tax=Maribacter sp. 2304DJ31-5 TaxID=3386273 RepID=UPI0039BD5FA3
MKKFNLGRELSKNEQKNVTGGATVLCFRGANFPWGGEWTQTEIESCSGGAGQAYCQSIGANIFAGCN